MNGVQMISGELLDRFVAPYRNGVHYSLTCWVCFPWMTLSNQLFQKEIGFHNTDCLKPMETSGHIDKGEVTSDALRKQKRLTLITVELLIQFVFWDMVPLCTRDKYLMAV